MGGVLTVRFFLFISLFCLLAACGVEQPPDTKVAASSLPIIPYASPTPTPLLPGQKPDLTGTWNQACTQTITNGTVQGSSTAKLVVGSGVHVSTSVGYQSANCTGPSATVTITSNATIGNLLTSPAQSFELTKTVTSATLTPNSSLAASGMNLLGVCGLSGWQSGMAKDITGLNCFGTTVFANDFQIIQLAGSYLYMGLRDLGHDGSTLATRPIALDPTPYIKQ